MVKKPRHLLSEMPPGVEIGPAVSLAVDWDSLASSLVTVAAQGFAACFGVPVGAGGTISALVAAAASIRPDTPVSQRAWTLFCLSFAWAFDELRELGKLSGDDSVGAVRSALESAKAAVEQRNEIMPACFLERPTSLPLYSTIRDEFVRRKGSFRPGEGDPDAMLRARFDAAFNRGVYEVWSRNPELFQPLEVALRTPTASASAFDVQWRAYRKALIHEFEVRPVFGQEQTKIAASQLYIPLRATWSENIDTDDRVAGTPVPHAQKRRAHVVKLDEELDAWVSGGIPDDCIRLIGGGPGSGKSTTVRALARRTAERDDRRPLFVPLQYIDISRDLREAINAFFVDRTRGTFRQPPLSRDAVEHGPPLVLIFDGLDELARPGEAANEVARLFITKLDQLVASLRGDSISPLRVVVTGRLPSFQAARMYASANDRRSYEVAGFLPIFYGPDDTSSEGDKQKGSAIEAGLAKIDQRPIWWQKYALAVGGLAETPHALTDPRLEGLTHEPLLCYLLALSGYAVDDWQKAAENRNNIYERLVNDVWTRGWGDGGRRGAARHLSKDHFNRLMETIALAAWHGGDTKVATEARFLESLSILGAEEPWEQFKTDSGSDIANLAMNFYLRNSETERRGFEFTHKSFGDYLTGRALLAVTKSVLELGDRRLETAGQEWLKATSVGLLTSEIVQFVRDEARLDVSRNGIGGYVRIKNYFVRLAEFAIHDGLPAQRGQSQNWRAAENSQNNAETAIWAILNASALAIGERGPSQARIQISWGSEHSFAQLLDRLGGRALRRSLAQSMLLTDVAETGVGTPEGEFSVRHCLAYVDAKGADLFEAYLHGADLRCANLSQSVLSGAHLCAANVSGSNLTKAIFQRAHLDEVDFRTAMIEGASFNEARIRGAKFSEAQLKKIEFDPLSLADPFVEVGPKYIIADVQGVQRDDSLLKNLRQILNRLEAVASRQSKPFLRDRLKGRGS